MTINLADYGNDTVGIDQAIAAAQSSGRAIYAPGEYYTYEGTLDLSSINSFKGDGSEASIFNITPDTGKPLCIYAPQTADSEQGQNGNGNYNWGEFSGFKLKGQATGQEVGNHGLQLGDTVNGSVSINAMNFRDIQIQDVGDDGLRLDRAVYGCLFDGFNIHDTFGIGYHIVDKGNGKANANRFISPRAVRVHEGIRVGASYNNVFYSPWIECLAGQTVGTGWAIQMLSSVGNVHNCKVYDPYIEWNETEKKALIGIYQTASCGVIGGYIASSRNGAVNTNNLLRIIDYSGDYGMLRDFELNSDHYVLDGIRDAGTNLDVQHVRYLGNFDNDIRHV